MDISGDAVIEQESSASRDMISRIRLGQYWRPECALGSTEPVNEPVSIMPRYRKKRWAIDLLHTITLHHR